MTVRSAPMRALGVIELRQFADRHAVAHGHVMPCGEARVAIAHGTFDEHAADRIRAVEHEEFQFRIGRGGEAFADRGDVGVEAAADVLDVEDERVEPGELFGRRRAAFAVEADRPAGRSLRRGLSPIFLVELARGCRAPG